MPQGMSGTFDNASNKWGILKYSRDKKKKIFIRTRLASEKKSLTKLMQEKK